MKTKTMIDTFTMHCKITMRVVKIGTKG